MLFPHTGGSLATWSKVPTEDGLLLPLRTRKIGVLAPLMSVVQRDGSQVLQKDIPRSKGQLIKGLSSLQRDYIHFKDMRKYLQ